MLFLPYMPQPSLYKGSFFYKVVHFWISPALLATDEKSLTLLPPELQLWEGTQEGPMFQATDSLADGGGQLQGTVTVSGGLCCSDCVTGYSCIQRLAASQITTDISCTSSSVSWVYHQNSQGASSREEHLRKQESHKAELSEPQRLHAEVHTYQCNVRPNALQVAFCTGGSEMWSACVPAALGQVFPFFWKPFIQRGLFMLHTTSLSINHTHSPLHGNRKTNRKDKADLCSSGLGEVRKLTLAKSPHSTSEMPIFFSCPAMETHFSQVKLNLSNPQEL